MTTLREGFDISLLLQKTFPNVPVFGDVNVVVRGSIGGTNVDVGEILQGLSIRMPVRLKKVFPESGDFFQLPNEPIISVRGDKIVNQTPLNIGIDESGRIRKGTVKEVIVVGDYRVVMRGIAYNEEEDLYPESQMKDIINHMEFRGVLEVDNYLLNNVFKIKYLVPLSPNYQRSPEDNFRSQPYELAFISDDDIRLDF